MYGSEDWLVLFPDLSICQLKLRAVLDIAEEIAEKFVAFYSFARYKLKRARCILHFNVEDHQFHKWLLNMNYPRAWNVSWAFRIYSEWKLLTLLVCDADIEVLEVFYLLRETNLDAILLREHIQSDYLYRRNERDQPFMIVPGTLIVGVCEERML